MKVRVARGCSGFGVHKKGLNILQHCKLNKKRSEKSKDADTSNQWQAAQKFQDIFLQGKRFHEHLEHLLSPQGNLKEKNEHLECGYMESVQHILKDISGVRALESAVQHESLKYAGLLDCVAKYQGQLCVIDWKTSEKPKPFIWNTYDNPLQVVAYMGAINHDANYSFQVQCGLIVVAYKDGSPAHPHFMDSELCSQYWTKWLLRLEDYTEKEKKQSTWKPG
uniref:mitochondrial genome maintenance exonuclease 1 isoform X3 n=1 Tax=Jaculus jaculus TaxID=51337 RepID=UPI001E1B369B|nr:mitochondrial genome maintenance exonuclease 1 isoform X3 [Jaculus jaculus]